MIGRTAEAALLTALVAVCAYIALGDSFHRAARTSLPSVEDESEWSWIEAEPGANVYVARNFKLTATSVTTVWVDRQFFATPVTVETHLIELWEVDCMHHMTRRLDIAPEYRDRGGTTRTEIEYSRSLWHAPENNHSEHVLLLAVCPMASMDSKP